MKHAVVIAHPRSRSFTTEMAHAYARTAEEMGDGVVVRDLYRMKFDPCLHAREMPGCPDFGPLDDVTRERALLADADVFALFYPLWFNAPPAMMKGYIDRVFSMGFGYGPGPDGQWPRLTGRKLISFTSSGAPVSWLHESGAYGALHTLVDQHLADMCGLRVVEHVHCGGVVPGFPDMAMTAAREQVTEAVYRHFSAEERTR